MTADLWLAPSPSGPVTATVRVPSSKSMTNRALVLAALASGRSDIRTPLISRDSELMKAALVSLGASVDTSDADRWSVEGGQFSTGDCTIDVGNAGTVLRFVPALAPLVTGTVHVDGDAAARRRPVGGLLVALRELGVTIRPDAAGSLPFSVVGTGLPRGGDVRVDATSSSQLVSALLLAAPAYSGGLTVTHVGHRPPPNRPHIDMTVGMLRERGIDVSESADRWRVEQGTVAAADVVVEPDLSSAAPFLAVAAVTGGAVTIPDWPSFSHQPGWQLPQLLEAFGAGSESTGTGLTLRGSGRISGAQLDLRDVGELTPVLAAVAALADSPSEFRGIGYLRGHETDRIAALVAELSNLGVAVSETEDGLRITPRRMRGGRFATYDDHRLAMAAAVIGAVVPGVEIENVATTAKTFPGFADEWARVVVEPSDRPRVGV